MKKKLREDAEAIYTYAIQEVLPDRSVRRALESFSKGTGRLYLIAVGKAAWAMADAASRVLDIDEGIVLTKYGHAKGRIDRVMCLEAGHPVLDENSIRGTEKILELTDRLKEDDQVLFLLSGGASALFEKPLIPLEELQKVNEALLRCGADIKETNTIRKRLSTVKGGRFGKRLEPAKITTIILSDVLGDPLDVIGSGPTVADPSTREEAQAIVEKYGLSFSKEVLDHLYEETPKTSAEQTIVFAGNVSGLTDAAARKAEELGYRVIRLSDEVAGETADAGRELAKMALKYKDEGPVALIQGGETTVTVKGSGKGGRNQEFALSTAKFLDGEDIAVFSIGSDGTDGPTEAAGGYCDGDTLKEAYESHIDIDAYMENSDSYHALKALGGLLITGATGTNVNDLSVALIGGEK